MVGYGAMVRALVSHCCSLGLIPRPGHVILTVILTVIVTVTVTVAVAVAVVVIVVVIVICIVIVIVINIKSRRFGVILTPFSRQIMRYWFDLNSLYKLT